MAAARLWATAAGSASVEAQARSDLKGMMMLSGRSNLRIRAYRRKRSGVEASGRRRRLFREAVEQSQTAGVRRRVIRPMPGRPVARPKTQPHRQGQKESI